ncbi:MAG: aspartate--tRNA(Asn) ligase [Candidatus Saccharimonadales bacterium]
MRILSNDVKNHVGEKLQVEGWLHKKRLLGGLTFINVRDRRGLIQVVLEDKTEVEKLRGLQIGTILKVNGTVVSESRAPGGAELHDASLEIMVPVSAEPPIEIDKPIDHKAENLDTLFEYRVLNVRNLTEQTIFKIRSAMLGYLRDFLTDHEFIEIQTPKLIAGATEGGTELFKVDYFGQEATLAQSPQLYKQIMVGAFERVFEIAPAFRAEPSATTRHMSEVMMLDLEMGFVNSHDEVLDMIGDMTVYALKKVYQQHEPELKSLNAPPLILNGKVPKMTVTKIHQLYSQAMNKDTTKEKDLIPEEERFICDYAKEKMGSELVFATHFPVEAMKFYHQVNPDDPSTVLWGDLLFRGLEIATCPLREYHYEKLIEQMKKAGLDINHPGYKYYLQAFKYGLPQHGGCGFGIDRFVEKTIGLSNVKEATLFPRDINRLTP